jgi:nucleotide-binding universal stress UspA family protein
MRVVCGTDFSERSRHATSAAAAIASRVPGSEVRVVHVIDEATAALGPAALASIEKAARARLVEEAERLRSGARVVTELLEGGVADRLAGYADEHRADLVIVASRGHSESPLWRLGGVSERLARSSSVPTLVVRDGGPFEAWGRSERALRVLLAVDWTGGSDAAIRWVKALRAAGACDVVVGYVYRSGAAGEAASRYGLSRRAAWIDPDPEAERLLARDLAARVGDLGGAGQVAFRPTHGIGRLGDHLLDLADAERVDLVVLGTHHRRGLGRLGSVEAVTLHHGTTAVAIVPSPHAETAAEDVPSVRRVVVPTDLSAASNRAIAWAYALVPAGGEVTLLHVVAPGEQEGEIAASLRALVPERGVGADVATRTETVAHRDPARAICEAAERLGADMVCMGSHGRSGLARAILGSVAESVVRDSSRPVLIVRSLPPS